MKKGLNKIRGVCLVFLVLASCMIFTACTVKDKKLDADEIFNIVKQDKDYPQIQARMPDFNPVIVKYLDFDNQSYQKLKEEWKQNDTMKELLPYFDKLVLEKETIFVEVNNGESGNGFYAIIDVKRKVSLLIVIKLNVVLGM